MNVVILFGGQSVEHDVSIITYYQVLKAIDIKKYQIYPVYISVSNDFLYSKRLLQLDNNDLSNLKSKFKYKEVNFIKKKKQVYLDLGLKRVMCDVVLNLTHGKDLEDGTLSGYLQMLGVAYSSSGVGISAVLHNKFYTKLLLNKAKVKVIDYVYVNKQKWLDKQDEIINNIMQFKTRIVKPCRLGSSIGVKISNDIKKTIDDINEGFKYDDEIIVEKCLEKYLEFNQAYYYKDGVIQLSKIEEIKNNSMIYTFSNKYENGDIKRVLPAKINTNLKNKITRETKKIAQMGKSSGVVRVDYLLDTENKILYCNEVNVIPGALAYYLFEVKGLYFSSLIDDLISEALRVKEYRLEMINSFNSSLLEKNKINKMTK